MISAWPVAGGRHEQIHPKKLKLAMALRGAKKHYRVDEIRRRHFDATARVCGVAGMDSIVEEIVANTAKVIDEVGNGLPRGFPEGVFAAVTEGLRRSGELLRRSREA